MLERFIPHQYPDVTSIMQILAPLVPDECDKIAGYLEKHFKNTFAWHYAPTTGFRADVIPLLDREWLVAEWREGRNRDVLALLMVDRQSGICSHLMHFGDEVVWGSPKRWRRSFLTWSVPDWDVLKRLFVVAQHALGVFQYDADIQNLDWGNSLPGEGCS